MGSVGAMRRVAATKHSVILPSINLLRCLNNKWMANGGHHHTESRGEPSLASHLLCTTSYDEDYVRGARSHSSCKAKESGRLISECQFILRQSESTEFLTMKMEAVGFQKGKNMGLGAHHNFVADPEVAGCSVMVRRVPCLCPGCLQRFKKQVSERYENPCDDCKYW